MTDSEKCFNLPSDHTLLVLRYIIVGFNALMGFLALLLVIYVFVPHNENANYEQFAPKSRFATPTWAAVVGIFLLVAAVIAFYASYSQIFYILIGYLILMIGIFILQSMIGIGVVSTVPNLKTELKKNMEKSMWDFIVKPNTWNNLQTSLECCGTTSPEEWFKIVGEHSLPASCCLNRSNVESLCRYQNNSKIVHQTGCFPKIVSGLGKPLFKRLLGFGITLQIIQVFNIVFVTIMAYIIWEKRHNEGSWDPTPTINL